MSKRSEYKNVDGKIKLNLIRAQRFPPESLEILGAISEKGFRETV